MNSTELIFSMPSIYYYCLAELASGEDISINEAVRRAIEDYGKIRATGVSMLREKRSFLRKSARGRYKAVVNQSYLQVISDVMKGSGFTFNEAMEIIVGQYVTTYSMREVHAEQSPSTCV